MKILFYLLIVISCGKKTNHFERDLSTMEMHSFNSAESLFQSLPTELRFQGKDHEIFFKSPNQLASHFYEDTQDMTRYYSYELSHIHPDSFYKLTTSVSENFEIYLNDLGKEILINKDKFKIRHEVLERLLLKKSYLYLAMKKESQIKDRLVIKDIEEGITHLWNGSLEDYLQQRNIEAHALNMNNLIEGNGQAEEGNLERWWVKKDSSTHYKIVYSSFNELKENFFHHFKKERFSVKRINGQGTNFSLEDHSFYRIFATRTLQVSKQHTHNKTFYMEQSALPYKCSYTEAWSEVSTQIQLSNDEIRNVLNSKDILYQYWNSTKGSSLKIHIPKLDSGYFEVGVLWRKCMNGRVPYVHKSLANTERELELVIESYKRRE